MRTHRSGTFLARLLIAGPVLLAPLCGCASSDEQMSSPSMPAEIVNEVTATAEVTGVDMRTRLVTLRGEDGALMQVVAGNEVRNLDQIAIGDLLRVRYKETLKASICPPGEDRRSPEAAIVASRAKRGATPGAAAGLAVTVRVRIESIDRERDIVVFSLSSGELRSRKVATEQGRHFVKGLKVGDIVQLDYTEAVALTIEKV